jgi:hypothetical protein
MFVKPGPHPDHPDDETKMRAVRIPHTYELLPAEGRDVPDNKFWRRRLEHGDVVKASPPVKPEPAGPVTPELPENSPLETPANADAPA